MISIVKNASYLLLGNAIIKSFTAFSMLLLARYLGAKDFGVIGVTIAFSGIATYFTDLGLSQTLMREGTKENADLEDLIASYLKIRVLFAVIIALLSILIIFTFYSGEMVRTSLIFVVIPSLFGSALFAPTPVYFQIKEKMQWTAFFRSITPIVTAVLLSFSVLLRLPLLEVACVYGGGNLIGGIVSSSYIIRKINLKLKIDRSLLSNLSAFAIGGMIIILMPQLPPLLLDKVSNLQQVGFYSAVSRIPLFLYQIPGAIVSAFYPLLFRYGNTKNIELHRSISITQLKVVSTVGIAVSLPFINYPEWVTELTLGKSYTGAVPVLAILCWVAVLQSVNYPLADTLTTFGRQHRRTILLLIELVLGTILYVILGSKWGALGAAIGQVSGEGILLIGLVLVNQSGFYIAWQGLKWNLVSLPLVLILSSMARLPALLGIPVFPLMYISLFLLLNKDFRKKVHAQYIRTD